jgi:hypothetical protein
LLAGTDAGMPGVLFGPSIHLLVVSGSPLENIEATRNIALVCRDGRLVVNRRPE